MSLLSPLASMSVVFVDVETTGASADEGDRVIEVGIVRYEGGRLVATYEQLLNPGRSVSPAVVALTGITPEMLAEQPTFADVQRDVLALLRGQSRPGGGAIGVVGGHNVMFDLAFLRAEFRKCGTDLSVELAGHQVVDTVRLCRKRFGRGGNGLQSLAERLELKDAAHRPHRALCDAAVTGRLFERLIEPPRPVAAPAVAPALFAPEPQPAPEPKPAPAQSAGPSLRGWDTPLVDLIQAQGGPMRLEGSAKKGALPLELEEALDRKRPVLMEYMDAMDRSTSRVITPLEVRKFRGELILLAHCALRGERRSFKLARIVRLSKPPELDPDTQLGPPGEIAE